MWTSNLQNQNRCIYVDRNNGRGVTDEDTLRRKIYQYLKKPILTTPFGLFKTMALRNFASNMHDFSLNTKAMEFMEL